MGLLPLNICIVIDRLFGNDFKGNFHSNFLVEIESGIVVADFLNSFLNHDVLAVNVEAEFLKGFSNLNSVDRAEDSAGRTGLGTDGKANACERSCESFSIGFDFSELVSALTLVFGKHFKRRGSGDNGFAHGDKVVAAVARLHFHHIVFISEVGDILLKYNLHNS